MPLRLIWESAIQLCMNNCKNVGSSSEFSKSFSESDQSTYQETSAGSNNFNHLCEVCVYYTSTDSSAQIVNTQNNAKNSDRVKWIQILD